MVQPIMDRIAMTTRPTFAEDGASVGKGASGMDVSEKTAFRSILISFNKVHETRLMIVILK